MKNTQTSIFMKIRPLGAEKLYEDGGQRDRHTDMTKLTVACRNFAKSPMKSLRIASNVEIAAKEIRQHVQSVQKSIQHEERAVTQCLQLTRLD
jgi:hypothetical protein